MQRSSHKPANAFAPSSRLVALAALTTLCAGTASAAPSLERTWGTYSGGDLLDGAEDIAIDAAGNLYLLGTTTSCAGIATEGAHKGNCDGIYDAYLAKFEPDGALVWATYFGGPDQDLGKGLAVAGDTVVIVGSTRSTSGISTPGAFQSTLGAGDDGFVAAFTLDGALKWSTYIGSSGLFDDATAAAVDGQGSVYAVGGVSGAVPGLGTPGAHQPNHGGNINGYLAKFTPQGQLQWGTYYGDSGGAKFEGVSLNALGELYASGTVYGPSLAIASPDAHQPESGGGLDEAMLVRFNLDGTRAWGTFYGGAQQDGWTSVAALAHGGVVLAGRTNSTANIATPNAHQSGLNISSDAFIVRFDAAGVRLWGTYYGHPWTQQVGRIAVDAADSIYLTGDTNWAHDYGTPNGYQPLHQGDDDAYLVKLSGDGVLQWGSYYGGPGHDGGCKIAVDANHRLYLAGSTWSSSGIATPGAHDDGHNGGLDSFLVQFTQPIGAACAGPDDCGGGPCVDGVCCDSACGGGADDCQVCSADLGASADGKCTPLAVDVVCRPAAGTCDAAEFCPGDAGTCPADVPAADGEPCDAGMCSAGACVPVEDMTTSGDSTTGTSDDTAGDSDTSTTHDTGATTDDSDTSTTHDTGATTGDSDTSSTSGTSDPPATTGDPTGDGPTTGQPDVTGEPVDGSSSESSGESSSASGDAPQDDAAGCGCRSGGGGGLLGAPCLLLLGRRRRATR